MDRDTKKPPKKRPTILLTCSPLGAAKNRQVWLAQVSPAWNAFAAHAARPRSATIVDACDARSVFPVNTKTWVQLPWQFGELLQSPTPTNINGWTDEAQPLSESLPREGKDRPGRVLRGGTTRRGVARCDATDAFGKIVTTLPTRAHARTHARRARSKQNTYTALIRSTRARAPWSARVVGKQLLLGGNRTVASRCKKRAATSAAAPTLARSDAFSLARRASTVDRRYKARWSRVLA